MFSSICLGASQDDTVYNDQRDVDAKGGIECRNKNLPSKFHDGYKRCHNNDVCWHTHAVRMIFRSREIIRLEAVRMTIVARPMPIPFFAEVVTASVGHIPSIMTKVGFSFMIPL